MGESSACLVRSFSLSSPTSIEDIKGNDSMQRALTTSVSFGRFVTESLDWEKWSAFTHNRHLEEVERYSKPGSVAEKKAYFEDHFKRRRAAALLEQQNAVVSNHCSSSDLDSGQRETNLPDINEKISVNDNRSCSDLDSAQRDIYGKGGDSLSSHVGRNESNDASSETNSETGPSGEFDEALESPTTMENDSNDAPIKTKLETGPSGEFEEVSEPLIAMETPRVDLTKIPENDECIGEDVVSKKDDKACNKDDSNKRNLASLNEKKSKISSSSKLSTNGGVSTCAPPVNQIRPSQIRNSVKTPDSKNIATMNLSNNRTSSTTSLHMSPPVNQIRPSQIRNSVKTPDNKNIATMNSSNKRSSDTASLRIPITLASSPRKAMPPGLSKVVANSKQVRVLAKKYENSTIPQTSTRISVCGVSKHHSAAPPAENRRTVTSQGDSKLLRKTVDLKVHPPAENKRTATPQGVSNSVRKTVDWIQSSDFAKSSNTFEGKTRLPTVPSPFTFKSEERAAKRKEYFQKLEQNLKLKETEKREQHAKSQVKARSSFNEVRNTFVSKETENAEVPPRKEVPSNLKKKIPTERRCFHKTEEISSHKVQDNDSRPPWSLSAKKTKELKKDVLGINLRPFAKCSPKKTNENASPNIQV